jgi:hypothetical protein
MNCCTRCKIDKPSEMFLSIRGKKVKMCQQCRDYMTGYRKKYNCEHDRARSVCKECGGGSICEHDRVRSVCRECGGGTFCIHGRQRCRCRECKGSSFCEHGTRRSNCKECVLTK